MADVTRHQLILWAVLLVGGSFFGMTFLVFLGQSYSDTTVCGVHKNIRIVYAWPGQAADYSDPDINVEDCYER
jgi:hypothetical protein